MRTLTRREFGKIAAAAVPAASAVFTGKSLFAQAKANSRIHGVQIGAITGSFQGVPASDLIPSILKVGLSEIELLSTHAEGLAGAPAANAGGRGGAGRGPQELNADGLLPRCANMQMVLSPTPGGGPAQVEAPRPPLTPEQEAAQQKLREWRRTTTPDTWKAVRKQFDDAGIDLRLLWYSLGYVGPAPSDEDIEYAFSMAHGLGVKVMSGSSTITICKRIGLVAEKYNILWSGHTQDDIHNPEQFTTPDVYRRLLAISPNFRICLDVGYFTAAGFDAVPFIQKNHKMITDIHLKDRKRSKSLGGDVTNNLLNNWPWGQGDSPIREVLELLKKEKYDIPANIEYDYGCRTANDAVTEITRCYDYAKMCLA